MGGGSRQWVMDGVVSKGEGWGVWGCSGGRHGGGDIDK